jgi:hypothetical protein
MIFVFTPYVHRPNFRAGSKALEWFIEDYINVKEDDEQILFMRPGWFGLFLIFFNPVWKNMSFLFVLRLIFSRYTNPEAHISCIFSHDFWPKYLIWLVCKMSDSVYTLAHNDEVEFFQRQSNYAFIFKLLPWSFLSLKASKKFHAKKTALYHLNCCSSGVLVDFIDQSHCNMSDVKKLCFIANWDNSFNIEQLGIFLTQFSDRIDDYSSVEFYGLMQTSEEKLKWIVGKYLSSDKVTIRGYFEDYEELLRNQVDFGVVGFVGHHTGLQIKLIEAARSNVPVLTVEEFFPYYGYLNSMLRRL